MADATTVLPLLSSLRTKLSPAGAGRQATATHQAPGLSASPPWERPLAMLRRGWHARAPTHDPRAGGRQPQRQEQLSDQREHRHRFGLWIRIGFRFGLGLRLGLGTPRPASDGVGDVGGEAGADSVDGRDAVVARGAGGQAGVPVVGRRDRVPVSQRDPAKDFAEETLRRARNNSPTGMWSDGTTMWVADSATKKIYAYDLATRAHDPAKDLDRDILRAARNSPQDVWSDGTTMWVLDNRDSRLFAYDPRRRGSVPALTAAEAEQPGAVTYAEPHSQGGNVTVSVTGDETSFTVDDFEASGSGCSFSFQGMTLRGLPISNGRFSGLLPPLLLGITVEVEGTFSGNSVSGSFTATSSSACEASASCSASRR